MEEGGPADLVVLLDEQGRPCGTADRTTVHDTATPLHLAFSCWVLDEAGRVLVTRRALAKRTWPGVWTNSFCGHPRPGEDVTAAVHRYARRELGLEVADVRRVLPDFAYRAVDAGGVVENEVCPVHLARAVGPLVPDPAEVAEHAWVDPAVVLDLAASAPWALSPWAVEQSPGLRPFLLPG